jgi:CheY-like chemotaxis protein
LCGAIEENPVARIVLVADDSPTIQKRALGILKGEGFDVETVSNGVAAIKRLAVIHPVVILADVSMPGRDGYEVCEFVKKSPDLSHVPVLLVASDMEPYDDARGAEVKADGIIKKPFEAQELVSIVVKFAEQSEAAPLAVAAPSAPSPAAEATKEFAFSLDDLDDAPTVVQKVTPDFSAASEGVPFAEPATEASPEFSIESQPPETELSYPAPQANPEIVLDFTADAELVETIPDPEPPSAPDAETPSVAEEPPEPPPAAPTPSFLEGLEAAMAEPVFIEESPAPISQAHGSADEFHTLIFHAPLDIAEPVWTDDTVAAPPVPEPAGPTAAEPQPEAEAPVASPEIPAEQPVEPPQIAHAVSATSLDSFSLEDATAGQVHFAPGVAEVAPVEIDSVEIGTAEIGWAEIGSVEIGSAEVGPVEIAPVEIAPAEIAPVEIAPAEVAPLEVAFSGPAEEAPAMEVAPAEPAPEAASEEIAYQEAMPESAPPEPLAEVAAPLPTFDWSLVYSIVHKVVLRMAPPALPMETVEELSKRLAEEIATEIVNESSHPPE